MSQRDDVEAIIAEVEAAASRVVKAIAINVTAELVERTPVDTGWASANWVPSVGAPSDVVAGSPDAVTTTAREDGLAAVARYRLEDGPAFVSNNVPYIGRLNEGHSAQAPAGFVQQAVEHAVQETVRDLAASGKGGA